MNSQNQNFNPAPFQSKNEDEIDLKVLLFNYLKYWPLILISMLIGIVVAFFATKYMTPIFQVEATVVISDDKPALGTDLFESSGLLQGKNNIENEIGILKSYTLAEEAISELNFNVSYFKEGIWLTTQLYGNVPVFVSVDWKHPQLVGGMLKLTVVSEKIFALDVPEEGFQVYNPNDPFYKTGLSQNALSSGRYTFG